MSNGKTPHFLEGIKKGWLHDYLGIPQDQKIPLDTINGKLSELEGIKEKTPEQLHAEKALNLAKRFHSWRHK